METHLTIDFYDDVMGTEGEWDEAALRRLVREVAEHHVAAIHWIGHGRFDDGMWDAGTYFDRGGKARRLRERLPRARPVLADEAHRCGMKVWDVLKPFDLAFGQPYAYYPQGQGPRPPVGLPQVGAEGSDAIRWLRENPQFRMRIHPALDVPPEAVRGCFQTIRIWHRDAALPELPELEIYVSEDNTVYRPLGKVVQTRSIAERRAVPLYAPGGVRLCAPERPCAGLEIGPVHISQPFAAICFKGRSGFVNTLVALTEVFDEQGAPIPFSSGFASMQPHGTRGHDWTQIGLSFDTARSTGLPRDQVPSLQRCELALDSVPCLGLARGRNRYLVAPLELAVPGAQEALLGMIDDAIEDGVDGVDLRMSTHTESLDSENYGFNPEIRALYQARYGMKPDGEGFDRERWQRLRTEALTDFMRRSSRRLRAAGRGVAFHVDTKHEHPADQPCHLGYWWPWREWAAEGLFDNLTAKQCPVEGELAAEVVRHAHAGGLSAWANRKPPQENREAGWIKLMDRAAETGFDAFNIYECANLVHLQKDGTLVFDYPRLWERVKSGSYA